MKISVKIFFIYMMLLMFALSVSAKDKPADTGASKISFSLAYNGSYLFYKETRNDITLSNDSGWQSGGSLELKYDNKDIFIRINLDIFGSKNSRYDGTYWSGLPLSMSRQEFFCLSGMDAGYKILNLDTYTLSLYFGSGYRYWERGQNSSSDYLQIFSWAFWDIGAYYTVKIESLSIGIDLAFMMQINPKAATDFGGRYDSMTFALQPRDCYRINIPIIYEIYRVEKMKIYIFLTSYFERWNTGRSPMIYITKNSNLVVDPYNSSAYLAAYEPDSYTNIYGFKLGAGVTF